MSEGLSSNEVIIPKHLSPDKVVKSAKERGTDNLHQIIVLRDIQNSEVDELTAKSVFDLTGRTIDQFRGMIKKDLEGFKKTLSIPDPKKMREDSVVIGSGGDSLTLDPHLIKEKRLKTGKKGNVEFLVVKNLDIDGRKGEVALVKMFRYGVLKKLVLAEGNPGNQIEWEAIVCLENKSLPNSHLTIISPESVKDNNGLSVAQDNGIKIDLHPGDVFFAPLGVARQLIPNNANLHSAGVKYLYYSPAWDTSEGIHQAPVYWPSQIKKNSP